MPEGVLLATAIHEDGRASLTQMAPKTLRVEAGHDFRLRIAYRLVDEPYGKQTAVVTASVKIRGFKSLEGAAGMHDRPFIDDSRHGEIVFDVDGLPEGTHLLQYKAAIRASDDMGGDGTNIQEAHVDGSLYVQAI